MSTGTNAWAIFDPKGIKIIWTIRETKKQCIKQWTGVSRPPWKLDRENGFSCRKVRIENRGSTELERELDEARAEIERGRECIQQINKTEIPRRMYAQCQKKLEKAERERDKALASVKELKTKVCE